MAISSLCSWVRLEGTAEVWGLFSHLIPSEALSRFESGSKRQGMDPDFRFKIPSEHGESQVKLAELKLLSWCPTWYTPTVRSKVRATEKRAQCLQKIYWDNAKALDQTISGTNRRQRGPVERRLDEFGDIMGLGPWVRPARMSTTLWRSWPGQGSSFKSCQKADLMVDLTRNWPWLWLR